MVGALGGDRQAFTTHLNYADCLANLMRGTSLDYTRRVAKQPVPLVDEKQNLVALTMMSLEQEFHLVELDADYSYASTSWLPVKGYYLLFNLLLTIQYLIDCQPDSFRRGHEACVGGFTRKLGRDELQFDNPLLNQVFDRDILSHRDVSGANLTRRIGFDRRFRLAMGKGADYKLESWKRSQKVGDFRAAANRAKKDDYLAKFQFSIFEFPYHMRLRANYRDFAFIEGVSTSETARYFRAYYDFVMEFARILEALKAELVAARTS